MARRSRSIFAGFRSRPSFQNRRSLRFEPLEDRQLLAVMVTTLTDEADGSITDGDVSLRDAIALAPLEETITFAPALVAGGPATLALTLGEIVVNKSVSIIGPGSNLLTIDANENAPLPNDFGSSGRVFMINDGVTARRNVLVQGLTLTGSKNNAFGGSIRNFESLTIRDAVFRDNSGANGGAIGSVGPLEVYDSEFVDNHANLGGGAIHVSAGVSSTQIVRSVFRSNDTPGPGGAINSVSNNTGVLTVTDSLLDDNDAGQGGGISCVAALVVRNSSIVGNDATVAGGGIFVSGTVTIERSLIDDNSATFGGGLSASNIATVKETTISNNQATMDGGGVNAIASINFTQVTVSGNRANGGGGGMYVTQPSQIRHSTIAGNVANANNSGSEHGGGIQYIDATAPVDPLHTVTLDHTIVANNSRIDAGSSVGDDLVSGTGAAATVGSTFGLRYSLVEVGTGFTQRTGTGFEPFVLGVDPKLGILANNGGPILPGGRPLLTHAAFVGSAAINGGDPAAMAGAGGVPQFDARGTGWSRVAGGRIDMGATESNANPHSGDYNYNGAIDSADYTLWRDGQGATSDPRPDGSGAQAGTPDGVVDDLDYGFWKSKFVSGTTGDYNLNSVVDAADYTVWRDTIGEAGDLRADGSGVTSGVPDGQVDAHDYTFWKSMFVSAQSSGGGIGGGAAASDVEPVSSVSAYLTSGRQGRAAADAVHEWQSTNYALATDSLMAWLVARSSPDTNDGECELPSADDGARAPGENGTAFDCVFDLLGAKD